MAKRILAALRRVPHSLRNQLVVSFVLAAVLVLTAGSIAVYSHAWNILRKNTEKNMMQQFAQADHNINTVLTDTDRLSKLFLLDGFVQDLLLADTGAQNYELLNNQTEALRRISQFLYNYSYINSIYLYSDNESGLGGNERNTRVIREYEDGQAFFSSPVAKQAYDAYPAHVLVGGVSEVFYNPYADNHGTAWLVSVARSIKPIAGSNRRATLVFNLNESYISAIYSSLSGQNGLFSIIDSAGTVVSSGDSSLIGSRHASLGQVDLSKDHGSFTVTHGGGAFQGAYYRISGTGWYFVGEVPLQELQQDVSSIQAVMITFVVLSVLLIAVVTMLWTGRLLRPLGLLADAMQDMSKGRLGLTFHRVPKNEFGIVIQRFNEMSLSIVDLLRRNNEMQEEKNALELEALQHQINPHFLYNTLNMIKWMAIVLDARNIEDAVVSLSSMLRPLYLGGDRWSVLDEINYISHYIRIANLRFNNAVSFRVEVPEPLLAARLPRLILQPVVENSITHGMAQAGAQMDISVHAACEGGTLTLLVADNGAGIDAGQLAQINDQLQKGEQASGRQSGSIGLYNVNRRIRLAHGLQFGLGLRGRDDNQSGLVVEITVPYEP